MAMSSRNKIPSYKVKKYFTHVQGDSTQSQTPTSSGVIQFKASKTKLLMPGFTPVKAMSPARVSTKSPSSRQTNFYHKFNTQRNSVNNRKQHIKMVECGVDPLENMKKQIYIVFKEYNEQLATFGVQCSQLDIELEHQFSQIQDEYIEALDQVYIDKVNRMKEVNEKYDYDIYISEYNDKERFNVLNKEKEKEVKEIEEEFGERKRKVGEVYKEKVDNVKESHIKKKQEFIMGSKIISDMKCKINRILNTPLELDDKGRIIVANI